MSRIDLHEKPAKPASRALWPLWLALAGTLVAAPLYIALLDSPAVRATGWPMFLIAGVAALIGFRYARWDDRLWVRIVGGANPLVLAVMAVGFFWLSALPIPQAQAATIQQAPGFTLWDQKGRSVALGGPAARGAALLIFYRGFW